MSTGEVHPLVVEAMKKAAVAWIGVAGHRPVAAWLVWLDGAAYVVHGGGEQAVPGLATTDTCTVTARGDNGARIVTWPAAVTQVEPGSERWTQVVPQLVAKRLNLLDPGSAPDRWARESVVSRLSPAGDPVEAGDSLPDGSLAAPPPESPAATPARRPFVLGRRRP